MNLKRLIKPAIIFVAGFVVGLCALPFCFMGWNALENSSAELLSIPSTNQTVAGVTVEMSRNGRKEVVVRREKQQAEIAPPLNVTWTKMFAARDANVSYLMAEGHGEGHQHICLFRLALPDRDQSISNYNLTEICRHSTITNRFGEAFLMDLEGVANDGKRLLLNVGSWVHPNPYEGRVVHKFYYYYPADDRFEELTL